MFVRNTDNYHLGKANVVANALSRKSHCNTLEALLEDGFNLLYPIVLHNITISCSLESKIIELQKTDVGIFHIKRKMKEQETNHFRLDERGVLWFEDQLVVPKDRELRNQILDEAHSSKLSIHPGSSKMYQDLKTHFWWTKMKQEIAAYVARCDNCSRVKAIHLKSAGLQQTWLEMGGNKYGLYYRPLVDTTRSRFYMGHCRSPHQVSTFCTG